MRKRWFYKGYHIVIISQLKYLSQWRNFYSQNMKNLTMY